MPTENAAMAAAALPPALISVPLPVPAGIVLPDFGGQNHRIQNFHYSSGVIGLQQGRAVEGAWSGGAAVDVGAAVFAAEHGPFGEYGQTVEHGGAIVADHSIGQNPVVKRQIDAVMAAVEGYRCNVDIGCDQFRAADTGVGGTVQNGLGAGG